MDWIIWLYYGINAIAPNFEQHTISTNQTELVYLNIQLIVNSTHCFHNNCGRNGRHIVFSSKIVIYKKPIRPIIPDSSCIRSATFTFYSYILKIWNCWDIFIDTRGFRIYCSLNSKISAIRNPALADQSTVFLSTLAAIHLLFTRNLWRFTLLSLV